MSKAQERCEQGASRQRVCRRGRHWSMRAELSAVVHSTGRILLQVTLGAGPGVSSGRSFDAKSLHPYWGYEEKLLQEVTHFLHWYPPTWQHSFQTSPRRSCYENSVLLLAKLGKEKKMAGRYNGTNPPASCLVPRSSFNQRETGS